MSQTKTQFVSGITISGTANEVAFDGGPFLKSAMSLLGN